MSDESVTVVLVENSPGERMAQSSKRTIRRSKAPVG